MMPGRRKGQESMNCPVSSTSRELSSGGRPRSLNRKLEQNPKT